MNLPSVAFLGTGIMGLPMARNLSEGGYALRVWNRSAEKARALGGMVAGSVVEAVEGAEFVVVMVSDGEAVDAVLFGEDGAVAALGEGACVIVCSTIPPHLAKEQAKRCALAGADYLDAPVSGGEKGACEGTLAIMVGGEEAVFARAEPLLAVLGTPRRIGGVGCGQLAKLANQAIVGTTIAALAEALLLARAGGADVAAVREALMGGFADSTILRQHGERMINGDFTPGGPALYQLRDLRNAAAVAAECGVETPMTTTAAAMFEEMIDAGFAEFDHSAIYQFWQQRGVKT